MKCSEVRKALTGRFERRGHVTFVLDQVELDATGLFGGFEDLFPGDNPLAEESFPLQGQATNPSSEGNNASGMFIDERHRISAGLNAVAHIQLKHHLVWGIRGEDVHRPLAIDGPELRRIVVTTGAQVHTSENVRGFREHFSGPLPAVETVNVPGLARTTKRDPRILFKSIAL